MVDYRTEGKERKCKSKSKIGSELEPKNHHFSYAEILNITNNFEKVIGKGGFGSVYHGYLNDTQVAVKMLSASSTQGDKEFLAEVKLLTRVHHRNLTSLIGYCIEDNYMGLIYEYMANGNLGRHLSEGGTHISTVVAGTKGYLDPERSCTYLSRYVLLSAASPLGTAVGFLLLVEGHSHLGEVVWPYWLAIPLENKGRLLSLKSNDDLMRCPPPLGVVGHEGLGMQASRTGHEVPSGALLLVVHGIPSSLSLSWFFLLTKDHHRATGRPAIVKINDQENSHISQWVASMLKNGEIKNIVDPRLRGDFQNSSAWKAVETAIACVHQKSSERPGMNQVVIELNECLASEISSKKDGSQRKDSIFNAVNLNTSLNPMPR
ncbi:hypothetical protein TIFTF001_001661 [Ficus carica]|uniref:Protein kinase domain-containing protein n=1 Tax=Ficus carica TaxID=3494 RepID=A0AA88CQU0_FICCA|nr:hypothetical protein TIFTF001_001661 [Ficus carica]